MATFHENLVQSFKNFRDKYLKANGVVFQFSYDSTTGKFGYKDANGNFVPFKKVQASKTVSPSTSQQTVTPDSGYDGIESVTVFPIQASSVTPSSSGVYFSSGLKNMTSSGYAYSSRPSQQSGYMSSGTTLWSNPSPTSNQPSATKSLDSGSFSSYEWLEFVFRALTTDSREHHVWMSSSDFANTGNSTNKVACFFPISGGFRTRSIHYVSPTSFAINGGGAAQNTAWGGNNNNGILVKIIGHNIYP